MSNSRSTIACPDPREGLLAPDAVVQITDSFRMRAAHELARLGVVDLTRRATLRCIHYSDGDADDAVDPFCKGEVYLRVDACDPFGPYHCPRCGRSLDATQKQKFGVYLVSRNMAALRRSMHLKLQKTGLVVREHPKRCFRLGARDYACVLLVDDANDKLLTLPMSQPPLIVYTGDLLHTSRRDVAFSSISAVEVFLGPGDRFMSLVWRHIASFPFEEDEGEDDPPLLALPPAGGCGIVADDWPRVTIYLINGDTIGVRLPGGSLRVLTAAELGMARSRDRVRSASFRLLAALCAFGGRCTPQEAGFASYDAMRMQSVKLARELVTALDVPGNPFEPVTRRGGLVARFVARARTPEDFVAASTAALTKKRSTGEK